MPSIGGGLDELPLHSLEEYLSLMGEMLQAPIHGTLNGESGLYDDWGIDSLQAFELIILTEQLAGIHIPPADIPLMFTVNDAYAYYVLCHGLRSQSSKPS